MINFGLNDKVVFITGAASGIGLKIGEMFAKEESIVVISDINKDKDCSKTVTITKLKR